MPADLFNPREKVRGEALILADHPLYLHLLAQDLNRNTIVKPSTDLKLTGFSFRKILVSKMFIKNPSK